MANSNASSATVKVLDSFFVATDESSSSARISVMAHKEKFGNVLLSGDEPNGLYNIVKHLKTFTGLAEIDKSKSVGEKPEVMIDHDSHIVLFHHTELV